VHPIDCLRSRPTKRHDARAENIRVQTSKMSWETYHNGLFLLMTGRPTHDPRPGH
jgi:hypothetical protein